MMDFYRQTWIEVDLDAIAHNVKTALRLNASKLLMAVVKANGYGHGDLEVAQAALEAGASMIAVSSFDEALHLREKGLVAPLFVMGVTALNAAPIAIEQGISLTAHDEDWIEQLVAMQLTGVVQVHLKIDTGMHRIGLLGRRTVHRCLDLLTACGHTHVAGIYSHMATADSDHDYLALQVEKFQSCLAGIQLQEETIIHLANSATLLQFNHGFTQAVRLGISMYGSNPTTVADLGLQQTLALYTRVVQCKQIKKGDSVGYGSTYEAQADEWIGTLPIGYADGWVRANQGRQVVVNGHECEIVGRVCMDQMMIRLPEEMPVGEKVTLIGKEMPVDRVASELGTISYEVFCLLSDRIPRIYRQSEKEVGLRKMRFEQ